MSTPADLDELSRRLGHRFVDASLLHQALSHRSWCAERPGEPSNERLEFLGDAVLGLAVADLVYRRYPDVAEGRLTDARKAVVNATALAGLARELEIGPHILLGKGEASAGGADKASILSDTLEAVIGALELDAGAETARRIVQRWIEPRLDAAVLGVSGLDHKTLLQEFAARRNVGPPVYRITEEGPDHAKRFHAVVEFGARPLGEGDGRSKKQAEQAAAEQAWVQLRAGELDGSGHGSGAVVAGA